MSGGGGAAHRRDAGRRRGRDGARGREIASPGRQPPSPPKPRRQGRRRRPASFDDDRDETATVRIRAGLMGVGEGRCARRTVVRRARHVRAGGHRARVPPAACMNDGGKTCGVEADFRRRVEAGTVGGPGLGYWCKGEARGPRTSSTIAAAVAARSAAPPPPPRRDAGLVSAWDRGLPPVLVVGTRTLEREPPRGSTWSGETHRALVRRARDGPRSRPPPRLSTVSRRRPTTPHPASGSEARRTSSGPSAAASGSPKRRRALGR